jgi:hypothetical protein
VRAFALLGLLLLTGCPSDPSRGPASLIDHGLWEEADPAADPWLVERPDDDFVTCDSLSVFEEAFGSHETLSVSLDYCNYVSRLQSTLVDVLADDTLTFRLWHDGFFFATDEPVHLALGIGEEQVWDVFLEAPGDSGLEYVQWAAESDIPAGTAVSFLVNTHQEIDTEERHGGNSLNLIELSRVDPAWEVE